MMYNNKLKNCGVWMAALVAVTVAGILAPLTTVAAGTLTGTVSVPAATGAGAALNPYAGTLGSAGSEAAPAARSATPADVVVYIEGAGPATPSSRVPTLVQRNQQFHPRVVGIPAGSTVAFPNEDLVFHNVFSYSKVKRFDLGYYGRGKSKSVTFERAGLVQVFCDIHRNMSAFIFVVDSPFVVQPQDDGTYRFDNLPDGRYTVVAWHPELGERRRSVTISGAASELDLRF